MITHMAKEPYPSCRQSYHIGMQGNFNHGCDRAYRCLDAFFCSQYIYYLSPLFFLVFFTPIVTVFSYRALLGLIDCIMKSEDHMDLHENNKASAPACEKDGAYQTTSDTEMGASDIDTTETTKRGLKARHAQMIALGGTIGTGLFVGSGATLARGGPAFILIAYIIMSILVFFIVAGITEVAAYLPVSGGTMSYYGHRNVSNSLGFAMGWLYFYSLGILVPYEITAAGLVIDYWNSPVNIAVWITIFIVVIVGLNILPVQFYGETEFWFASLKVFMMIGLLVLSFILFWGGGPNQHG
jgi:amino acid transporter